MQFSFFLVLELLLVLGRLNSLMGSAVPLLLGPDGSSSPDDNLLTDSGDGNDTSGHVSLGSLLGARPDTSEVWREAELLALVHAQLEAGGPRGCSEGAPGAVVRLPSGRTVRPICRGNIDRQICPQCAHLTNYTECELFRDSCRERRVLPHERATYCDWRYGRWRAVLIPADYRACRCCDECVLYRELDQSCIADDFSFDSEEFLPVTSIDFRAGCNPYSGHPEQELRALRCDPILRRCVPVAAPSVPKESLHLKRNYRFEPPTDDTCPLTCRGYKCKDGQVDESKCRPGAFLPDKDTCNCCGKCSAFQQLHEKCAEFKKTEHDNNGTKEIEVEEEFLEPGCDDGLVCRQGRCQDIHTVRSTASRRRKRDDLDLDVKEPCKRELKLFKKKFGPDGHLHYNAPQCTPLWLYAPVQCRGFVCFCALEDGTPIEGVRVPRVEVSAMNCDCARERCRTNSPARCDAYGNYRSAAFEKAQGASKLSNSSNTNNPRNKTM